MFVNVLALKIHMSENARNAIAAFPEFIIEYRGDIAVKVEISLLCICERRRNFNGHATCPIVTVLLYK